MNEFKENINNEIDTSSTLNEEIDTTKNNSDNDFKSPNLETNSEDEDYIKKLYTLINGETKDSCSNDKPSFYTDGNLFSFLSIFILVFTSIVFTFNFMLRPIKVVGTSMQPTINSSAYYEGYNDETHCDIVYYSKDKSYNNNDIVVISNNNFKYVYDESVLSVIKRVIATPNQIVKFYLKATEYLPNESIFYSNYKYFYDIEVFNENGENINLDQSYLDGEMSITTQELRNYFKESYDYYEQVYNLFNKIIFCEIDECFCEIEISENSYFVMGDNRNNSTDSRFFGAVYYDDISGSVKLIVAYNSTLLKTIWIKLKSYF